MRIFRSTYKGRDGKTHKTSKWYIEFRDHLLKTRRMPAFTDRRQSEALGRQVEKLVRFKVSGDALSIELMQWLECVPQKIREYFGKIGLINAERSASSKLLADHIAEFQQSLLDKGDTRKQSQLTMSRVRRIAKECKFTTWTDISASKVQRCVAKMQGDGLSKKSANYYLKAFKHFCRWMCEDGRATESPVAHLKTVAVTRQDLRRVRRPLEPDEVRRLLEATRAAERRFNLTGHQRSMIYRLACESGLRANEIRELKVSDFDFGNCTVTAEDHTAKNHKEKVLPLRPGTAAEIEKMMTNKLPGAQAFKVPGKPIQMLRPDLERAGIEYQDEAGRYCDFHSLRHTTGSLLAASGVHPKIAQELMRHSDINLTMSLYTHTLRGQEADAVNKLPDFSAPSKESQRKTGTDDANVTDSVLASCLALSCAQHSPTVTSGETANAAHGIVNGVFDRAREDSNLQPSDSKSSTPRVSACCQRAYEPEIGRS